jgi:single-strand DNA-binding protein
MASLNKVMLLGNLTRDPELRYAPNGTPVANFGMAINRRYRQGDEWREEVCYVDVVTFGRQAETVGEYLSKGNLAMIEGRLQWRSWETEDGQKRSKHEVVANNVQFMPRTQGDGSGGAGLAPGRTRSDSAYTPPSRNTSTASRDDMMMPPDIPMPEDDDIPF